MATTTEFVTKAIETTAVLVETEFHPSGVGYRVVCPECRDRLRFHGFEAMACETGDDPDLPGFGVEVTYTGRCGCELVVQQGGSGNLFIEQRKPCRPEPTPGVVPW